MISFLLPFFYIKILSFIKPFNIFSSGGVYFSSFIGISIKQSYQDVIKIFHLFDKFEFHIFVADELSFADSKNVKFFRYDRDHFLDELLSCCGVISTAGHTLMGEALYCEKPFFAIPIITYDQYFCAGFIDRHALGLSSPSLTKKNLKYFLEHLDFYKKISPLAMS